MSRSPESGMEERGDDPARGVAVLAVALFTVTGLLFSPSQSSLLMVSPLSLLAAAMMGGWQWQLAGPSRGGRVVPAVVATVVVAFYTSIATLVFLIQSGFDD